MPNPVVDDELLAMRHSSAHILAQAVRERFKDEGVVHLGTGPATKEGFWYDFELPRPVTDEDLAWLQKRMRQIISKGVDFTRREISVAEARELFADEPYKLEIIDGIENSGLDSHGDPLPGGSRPELWTYTQDVFEDLCAGPHIQNSRQIDPKGVKLLNFGGAYWRGDQSRPMLQRIFGTTFKSQADLKEWEWMRAEAEKRDHRKLGKELDLFMFHPTAPGMPYWLPNGVRIMNSLLDFWREEHEARGYQEIASPLINEKALWETSGHWQNYVDDMFVIEVDEATTYGVKPMNCPNAMVVFNRKVVSYRDLPLRLSDCDALHRNERSGTLHGLLRVREFHQDDAHIFLPAEDIGAEYSRILDIADLFYGIFGLEYRLRLGTRPEKFVGDLETWHRAESILHEVLTDRVGEGNYEVLEGDGAFYGPKIDIVMSDAIGREWQMGTIQLDFQLPRRFGCTFTTANGTEETPVVIHRVIYGSLERFIAILLESTSGSLPPWLSPRHVAVIPVHDEFEDAAAEFTRELSSKGIRSELVPVVKGSLGARLREAHRTKTPYSVVYGRQEAEGVVSPRFRGDGDNLVSLPAEDFAGRVVTAIAARHEDPREAFRDLAPS